MILAIIEIISLGKYCVNFFGARIFSGGKYDMIECENCHR